jgi:hypothetical protein
VKHFLLRESAIKKRQCERVGQASATWERRSVGGLGVGKAHLLSSSPLSGITQDNHRVKSSQVKSIKAHVLGDTPAAYLGPGLMLISADSLPVCSHLLVGAMPGTIPILRRGRFIRGFPRCGQEDTFRADLGGHHCDVGYVPAVGAPTFLL